MFGLHGWGARGWGRSTFRVLTLAAVGGVTGQEGSGHTILKCQRKSACYCELNVDCNQHLIRIRVHYQYFLVTILDSIQSPRQLRHNCSSLADKMCEFLTRVHSCGHYEKSLKTPCATAKKDKSPCSSGSEDSKTTGGLCYISGCDKKPGTVREGPGKLPYLQQDRSQPTPNRRSHRRRF
jgi:hypothetical protein